MEFGVEIEFNGFWFREAGADGWVGEVKTVVEDHVVDVVTETVGGGAVHHAVLTHETGSAVLVDDELERLVEPPVATISVPVRASTLIQSHRGGVIQADSKGSGLDLLESLLVSRIESHKLLPGSSPEIAVGGRQDTNTGSGIRSLVNLVELLLKLGGIKLSAVNNGLDLKELVLADGNNMLILLGSVLDRMVSTVRGDTAGVEHPLV